MDFIVKGDTLLRTVLCTIASATVVEAGDVTEMSSGLVIKGTASGAKISYAPIGSASGDTQIELSCGSDFVLEGTGDAVFAVTQKGAEVDLVVSTGVQYIDVGSSSTDVFVIDISENAGTVGSASNIRCQINKPDFK